MKMLVRARRRAIRSVVLALLVIVVATSSAHAITLFRFTGIVTDALGRPLPNASVSDGAKTVKTGSDGRYVLEESSLGVYTLEANRSDTLTRDSDAQTVTVPLDRAVDFAPPSKRLLYRLQSG